MRDYTAWNRQWAGTREHTEDVIEVIRDPDTAIARLGKETFFRDAIERAKTITPETAEVWFDWLWTLSPVDQALAMRSLKPAGVLLDVVRDWGKKDFSHWTQAWKDIIHAQNASEAGPIKRADFEDDTLWICDTCGHEERRSEIDDFDGPCPGCDRPRRAAGTYNMTPWHVYSDGTRVPRKDGLI